MSLGSIIRRVIDLNTISGVTNRTKAESAAKELLRDDEEATEEAVSYCVTKMIHDSATKALRNNLKDDRGGVRQGSFFGEQLRAAYAIERTGVIKQTECLSRIEWTAVLQFRRKQVEDDTHHLQAMETANRELSPIWDEYPEKTYGEVEQIYLRRRVAAE